MIRQPSERRPLIFIRNSENRAIVIFSRTSNESKLNISFKPGDLVRIIIFNKNPLAKKSSLKQWTDEIYEVSGIKEKNNGEFIKLRGVDQLFTKNQLLKIGKPKELT